MNMPKVSLTGGGIAALVAVGVLWYLYSKRQALADAVNPLSDKNLAYTGTNSLLQAVTGNPVDTVGTTIANWFQPSAQSDGFQPTVTLPPQHKTGPAYFNNRAPLAIDAFQSIAGTHWRQHKVLAGDATGMYNAAQHKIAAVAHSHNPHGKLKMATSLHWPTAHKAYLPALRQRQQHKVNAAQGSLGGVIALSAQKSLRGDQTRRTLAFPWGYK